MAQQRKKQNRPGYQGHKYGSNDFLEDMNQLASTLREQIESAADLGNFDRSKAAIADRRKRVQKDFKFFCQTYFPHYGDAEPSEFHEWIFNTLPAAIDMPEGQRYAIAAPRGNAKSTYISQLLAIWTVLTGRKKFPLILSDAIEVAAMLLEGIKAELEDNPRLLLDFPEHTGRGPVWQVGTIVTKKNCKFMVGGCGKRIRGARHGSQRPDITFLDDLENDENVEKVEQRNKSEGWLDKVVENIGPPDFSMDVLYVGTVLHFDSVLARKLKAPLWKAKTFRAIIKWPARMDLWEKWEELLRDPDDKEGIAAEKFFQQNKKAMERGAKVLWEAVQPILKLMQLRVRLGTKAFSSEYQNQPIDSENQIFSRIIYWVVPVNPLVHFGSVDPSLGKYGKTGDPSAILIGGYNRDNGILDVLVASIRRRLPNVIISDVIALQKEYRCAMWFIEAVQFQEFLRTQMMKDAAKEGVVLPARGVVPNTDKILRIESMQPTIDVGQIRLHSSQSTLINQLETFPQGHDDGPDALHMLYTGAVELGHKVGTSVTGGTRTFGSSIAGSLGVAGAGILNKLRNM